MLTFEQATAQPLPYGWFHHGRKIIELLNEYKPKACVELGTYKGQSAIATGRTIREWGGSLTCVDTWALGPHGTPAMLAECVNNIQAVGLESVIRFMPCDSAKAAAFFPDESLDYVYVDAEHTEEYCWNDLIAWWPKVKPGGLILGDDFHNYEYPGVERAWRKFVKEREARLLLHDTVHTNPPGMQLCWIVKGEPAA